MKLLSRLVVVILAIGVSAAQADSITIADYNSLFRDVKDGNTYRFFQGGFDEGAFVVGFFRGVDLNGDGAITSLRECWSPNCDEPDLAVRRNDEPADFDYELTTDIPDSVVEAVTIDPPYGPPYGRLETEVSDFALYFSGNSLLDAFLISGIDALTSRLWDDGDDASGLVYRVGSNTIPLPGAVETDICDVGACAGLLVAREWLLLIDGGGAYDWIPNGGQYTTKGGAFSRFLPNSNTTPGGNVEFESWEDWNEYPGPTRQGSSSDRYLRVIRVPEPGTLALLGIGLAGMGLASRRRLRLAPA